MTPQQAVARGVLLVNGAVLVAIFGGAALVLGSSVLMAVLKLGDLAVVLVIAALPAGIATGWLVWSYAVPHWRRWAYARVADLDELKRCAVAERLIWPEGHIFQKTEIVSGRMRAEIAALEAARCGDPRAGSGLDQG